jgi:sodium transport system ATP-binding protein
VSLSFNPGKVFGLLGCNGAGKTTTLRMIATLLVPTRGTITVAGHDTRTRPRDVRASIGFLTSSTGLYERLSPAETIRYFAGLYGMPDERIDARVEELVERFDLGSFRDRPCGKLSSGQKQKASIARAVAHDPPILILDEPTATLDILVARTVIAFVEQCRAAGTCVVLSTHIMSEAERLCDEVAIIHGGKILAHGTVPELLAQSGTRNLEDAFFSVATTPAGAGAAAESAT